MSGITSYTVLGILLAVLAPPGIALGSERFTSRRPGLWPNLVAQLTLVLVVGMVFAIVLYGERRTLASLGFGNTTFWSLLGALALTGFFILVFGPAARRVLQALGLTGFEAGLDRLHELPLAYLVLAVLIGGFAEEVLYRGYAFERLADITGSELLAGTFLLLAFAGAHVPLWGIGPALTIIFSGALLTIFYALHRDIVANIAAHVLTDLVGIIGSLLARRR